MALMLHRMPFHLSGKVVGLCLDNSTVKVYVYKKVEYLFSFQTSLHILNLADKHGITLILAYIPMHFNVETAYMLWGKLAQEFRIFLLANLRRHLNQIWICWHPHIPISVSITTLCKHCYLWRNWD